MTTGLNEQKGDTFSHTRMRMRDERAPFPKMILVAGDGRNVGKTTFSVQITRRLSAISGVVGIKTTPHMHVLSDGLEILEQTEDYVVALEKGVHRKDSSLLLQAGAEKVYLIMAAQQHLGRAFSRISASVQNKICIAESGGLVEYVRPAKFFFIKNHDKEIGKKHYLEFDPVVVTNMENRFDFAMEELDVVDNKLVINA